jgi:hypothetical protein
MIVEEQVVWHYSAIVTVLFFIEETLLNLLQIMRSNHNGHKYARRLTIKCLQTLSFSCMKKIYVLYGGSLNLVNGQDASGHD